MPSQQQMFILEIGFRYGIVYMVENAWPEEVSRKHTVTV